MNKFNFNNKGVVRIIAVMAVMLLLCVTLAGCMTQTVSGGSEAAVETYTPSNGLWEKIAIPFGWIIRVCYNLIPNYAVALLIFAVIMKVILFPFGIKQQKNSVKQASLRPKEMAIRKKYAGRNDKATQQKVQQEIMDLYTKENFNPMGGCLPLLLQFPILLALFSVIRNPLRYITGLSVSEIGAVGNRLISEGIVEGAKKFSTGDLEILKLIKNPENFELVSDILPEKLASVADLPNLTIFGGLDLSATPEPKLNILILIPIVTFITVYLSMKLTKKLTYQPQQTGDAKTSGIVMDLAMPAMSTWFTFMYPAVLGLYWIFQNLLGVVQQLILKKMYPLPQFTEEDYKKAEQELMGKNKEKKKKPQGPQKRHPKSLHHIDDDDMEVMEIPEEKSDKKQNNSIIGSATLKDETDGKDN
ncbi:MAG: YidC/Oxa1 family membrane protein insertase [Clostridia bacterium]|nr:YidC/Oxa1 family membrane protein insertase [Clostridia bacterium]